ncbi:carboxylesterase family protein [Chryseobacterium sp. Ch-15]|uniref:Carboxylic ester hydrolase n=1 Tax=Chryseobacterium muglaense TaxID=2893752 RepID=A0A9Q3UXI5_9FLAO|nr:carboxylesterase family protein [Chryseobacterium muglaense]MBD3905860.1 carboxylesterase family protein [Chryseobacterium muglaense]MCC9035756.1 carboxylesterase family protein [Chryseobacterium muglaense]MCM2555466.1 carboxylesterase family protein [Chryseobacterium muglaense]
MTANNHIHIFQAPFGRITAFRENGILKAKNIRYAYSERFKKPIAIEPSISEITFPERTPVCPQNISPLLEKMIGKTNLDNFEVDESPQFVSVFRPENYIKNEKLSVIVWIHGGSYEIGCGDIPTADPTDWVKEQNVIVVTVSYRLGIFGFLGGSEEKPANLGLFDVIEGLKWIKNNIASFGGDSENITLFGQSSGGDLIAHLMISEGIDNLFKRVIIHSAPLGLRKNRQKMVAEFLKNTQIFNDKSDILEIIENYKNLTPSFLKYGLKAAMPFGTQYGFPPLCNEWDAEEKWKQKAKEIDVLIGLNDEETSFYLKTSDTINKYFPVKVLNRAIRTTTEIIYGKPAADFAKDFDSAGGNIYLFRIYPRFKVFNYFLGAHAIDLPFIFGNESAWKNAGILKNIPWKYMDENGKKLRKLWTEFANTGKISDDSERPEILEVFKV